MPYSRMKRDIAQVLMQKRFIENFGEKPSESGKTTMLTVSLRTDREPLEVKRISKPGQRIYIGHKNMKRVRNGLGVGIISTSLGILPDDEARKKKVGGEYLFEIW